MISRSDTAASLDRPALVEPEAIIPKQRWRRLQMMGRDKKAAAGLLILFAIIIAATFAPLITPYNPNAQVFTFLEPPSFEHPFGTDDLGRDLFARIIYGARISLFVGLTTVALSMMLGVLMGLLAGYYGGWVDNLIMRYIDLQWAFPNFIIAVYLVAVFGTGLSNVIVAVTLAFLDDFARITRGMVLSLREQEFVLAARSIGVADNRLLLRHLLPNAVTPIIVLATVTVSYAILAEAGLSFLGLGVKPSTPTWGLILSDARTFFSRAWWLAVFPGLAIMLTVLSLNFFGDALRDILDVREYQEEKRQ
jgi:peptide/nickel transport system permease protein